MYDNFKIANYNNSLVSPEFYARPLSRLLSGDVIDGMTVVPGTGLQVVLNPGNALLRYGSAAVASARIVSLVADFALAIGTPDASNPRIDLVVVYVDLAASLPTVDATHPPTSANLDGPGIAKAKIVAGTPASTPVAPTSGAIQTSVGASNPYTVVGQVLVDKAPLSVIAAGKISDVRSRAKVGAQNIDFATFTWSPYTPIWSTLTSSPAIGNGVLTGSYARLGNTVLFRLRFIPGSTSTYGSGRFRFTLPVAANANYLAPSGTSLGSGIGTWYAENTGVVGYGGNVIVELSTNLMAFNFTNSTSGGQGQIQSSTPGTWSSNWYLLASGSYEAA